MDISIWIIPAFSVRLSRLSNSYYNTKINFCFRIMNFKSLYGVILLIFHLIQQQILKIILKTHYETSGLMKYLLSQLGENERN